MEHQIENLPKQHFNEGSLVTAHTHGGKRCVVMEMGAVNMMQDVIWDRIRNNIQLWWNSEEKWYMK